MFVKLFSHQFHALGSFLGWILEFELNLSFLAVLLEGGPESFLGVFVLLQVEHAEGLLNIACNLETVVVLVGVLFFLGI